MEKTINEKSSKVVYTSMCYAYDVIVGNKDPNDMRYERALYTEEGLDKVLRYFEDIEEYEKCARIKRIMDEVYG